MRLSAYSKDRRIIERIRENDRTVLGELFMEYERLVMDQVRRLGGSNIVAEDLLQEAIIVLWQNVVSGRFEVSAKISTYISAVVRNKYLNEQRKMQAISNLSPDEDHKDHNPSPLDIMVSEEKTRLVEKALRQLNDVCRKILMLFYFEKRSLTDIARLLHFANEQVAKSKKYQCKKALKDIVLKSADLREET
jgi:RNA polymerase sigma factor (sigma-70 family)